MVNHNQGLTLALTLEEAGRVGVVGALVVAAVVVAVHKLELLVQPVSARILPETEVAEVVGLQ